MEKVMSSLDLGFLIRTVFAGAFFLISYRATDLGWNEATSREIKSESAIAISLLAGFACYAIHRAVLYPIVEWAILPDMSKPRSAWRLIGDNSMAWKLAAWEIWREARRGRLRLV